MSNPIKCVSCGDIVEQTNPKKKFDVCLLCSISTPKSADKTLAKRKYNAEKADIQYHGSRFLRGEW